MARMISATMNGRGIIPGFVKISIIKQPAGVVGGCALDHYHPGRVYDVAAHLANYLVAEGFAVFDRREDVNSGQTASTSTDRRKK